MSESLTDGRDILDSREINDRIDALRSSWAESTGDDPDDYASLSEDDWTVGLGSDDARELVALLEFRAEMAGYLPDWEYGATLIRDDYFVTYAQELAEDIGAISSDTSWPNGYIDWERAARDLRMDYTCAELDGVTYWGRS